MTIVEREASRAREGARLLAVRRLVETGTGSTPPPPAKREELLMRLVSDRAATQKQWSKTASRKASKAKSRAKPEFKANVAEYKLAYRETPLAKESAVQNNSNQIAKNAANRTLRNAWWKKP